MNKKSFIFIGMVLVAVLMGVLIPLSAYSVDKIIVKDGEGTTRFLVDDQGRIGIGTTTPEVEIDLGGGEITVNGADMSAGTGPGTRSPGLSWADTGRMNIGHGGAGGGNLEMYSKGHAARAGRLYFVYGGGDFGDVRYIHYNGSSWTDRVIITKDGYIGIGTMTPSYPIHLASGAHVTAGGVWTDASSREYKDNIESLSAEKAMEALEGLNPVTFNYKADKEERYAGFIAEDVPELVAMKDRKGLSPMDIVAVLTSVVKEQQKAISELTEEMTELKKELKLKGTVAGIDFHN